MITKKIQQFIILFLCFFISCFFTKNLKAQCTGVSVSDSLELVNFYYATDGDNWFNNDGWLVEPVSEWRGISVSEDSCFVKVVDLDNNDLSGELLDLNLPHLETLALYDNQLTGSIPDFSNLPNLKVLGLYSNQLIGNIPNFTNLPNLERIEFLHNDLTGNIPNFTNLPNLTSLNLGDNLLTGNIPDFSNIENLFFLSLELNSLTGNIPNFTNLPNLEKLRLSYSSLTGSIPDFSNLPNLKEIRILSLSSLTGDIPDFSNLPNLEYLDISYSPSLTGSIPDFSNLFNLKHLYLNDNGLTGSIPNFTNLPNLETLWLSNNELTGVIPNFTNLSVLTLLEVCDNNLFGAIPNFENCLFSDFHYIDYSCVDTLGNSIFEAENSLVKIYPNPAKESFFLDFSEVKENIENAKIEIYDVFGRLVLAQKINVVETHFNVSISDLQNGVYVYKIVGENDILGSGKIMVQ